MKKIFLLFLVVMAGVASCSSIHSSSEEVKDSYRKSRAVQDKTISMPLNWDVMKIANYTSVDVEYNINKEGKVVISGPEEVIDKISVEVKGSTLDIRVKSSVSSVNTTGVKVKVFLPDLNEVTVYGSGDFNADKISTTALGLNIIGSGDIRVGTIDTASVKLLIRGSGDVKIDNLLSTNVQLLTQGSGDIIVKEVQSTLMKSTVQGSGDVILDHLVSARAEALIQGSGDVAYHNLNVTTFQATVQGSGDIVADGRAVSASMTVQGTGSINARRLKCDRVSKSKHAAGDINI